MNETYISNNNSCFEKCLREMSDTLIDSLVSLIRMEQRPDVHQKSDAASYEVTFIPLVIFLLIVEQLIRLLKRQDLCRFQDFVVNMGASLIFVLCRSLVITVMVLAIYWIHDNYRVIDLPMNSIWTWMLTFLFGEFSLYWTHRAMHEINILWAVHSFHHMAEDLNFSATLRATPFDLFLYDIFAIPLAFFLPAQLAVFHIQLGFLYQIWLHNEVVGNLGFIEVLINTPRQHRVHHGKNRFAIDKNYGTFLMVWDRLFGTHQSYQEPLSVGLVSPTPKTYDQITLQFKHFKDIFDKFCEMKGFKNKLWVLVKGPGWAPGKPRLGDLDEVPESYPKDSKYGYDPRIPYWKKFYALIHISILFFGFIQLANDPFIIYTSFKGFVGILYIICFLTSIGTLFDNRAFVEILRCFMYFGFEYLIIGYFGWYISKDRLTFTTSLYFIRIIHIFSIIFWFIYVLINSNKIFKTKKPEDMNETQTTDIEGYNSNEKQTKYRVEQILFFVAVVCLIISFMFAFALNMKSCQNILNHLLIDEM